MALLQNKETHLSCFCYSDNKNWLVDLREFPRATTDTMEIHAQEILFLLKGRLRIAEKNGNERYDHDLSEGEFVYMPTGSRLICEVSENSTVLAVRLTSKIPECPVFRMDKIPDRQAYHGIYALKVNERIRVFLSGLLAAIEDGLKCRNYLKLEISRLLYLILACYSHEEHTKFFSRAATADVEFSEFVRDSHRKYQTVAEMAKALDLSTEQFTHRFRRSFGETPFEWLRREKAHTIYWDICQSNKNLKEIAHEHGFFQSNFSRYCQQTFGARPKTIRTRLLNIECNSKARDTSTDDIPAME